jgi:cob(I)alamin adenosyltransferase
MNKPKRFIHVYTGKGKGKTSAALGLALRAAGWGNKICVFQFMKKGVSGEKRASRTFPGRIDIVTFDQTHPIFYHSSVRKEASKRLAERISRDMKVVKEAILVGKYDMIILDEIVNAIKDGFVKKGDIVSLAGNKHRLCELVLTGRGAPKWLTAMADYVTEMREIKHPYKKGEKARKGIEY